MFLFPSLERSLNRSAIAALNFTSIDSLNASLMEDSEAAVTLLKERFLIQAGVNTSCIGNLHERVFSPFLYPITVGHNSKLNLEDCFSCFYFKLGNYAGINCSCTETEMKVHKAPIMYFQGQDFCKVVVSARSLISLPETIKNMAFTGNSFDIHIEIAYANASYILGAKEGPLSVYKDGELLGSVPEGCSVRVYGLEALKQALKRVERNNKNAGKTRLKPIPA